MIAFNKKLHHKSLLLRPRNRNYRHAQFKRVTCQLTKKKEMCERQSHAQSHHITLNNIKRIVTSSLVFHIHNPARTVPDCPHQIKLRHQIKFVLAHQAERHQINTVPVSSQELHRPRSNHLPVCQALLMLNILEDKAVHCSINSYYDNHGYLMMTRDFRILSERLMKITYTLF